MTARELFDLVRDSAVPSMADSRPVLDLLREHGGITKLPIDTVKRPGRMSELYAVHPDRALFFMNYELMAAERSLKARASARIQINALVDRLDAEAELHIP